MYRLYRAGAVARPSVSGGVLLLQQRRTMSQMMKDFVQPKYMQAYKALVLAQLKNIQLGEDVADEIISRASEGMAGRESSEPHVLASQLALSTYQVVSEMKDKDAGIKVSQETLLMGQIFETTTHKVATMLSWNKAKHAEKMSRDFCRDTQSSLDAKYDDNEKAVVVNKCFYVKFFRENGAPELAKIFCNAEKALFESASAPNSGLVFEMQKTIESGSDQCYLKFVNNK